MTAPERIWIEDERPDGGACHVHNEPSEGVLKYGTPYILETPQALASSPEVAALIEEARREWCKKMDRIADEIDEQVKVTRAYVGDCSMDHNQKELMKICTSHFLDKAATIRALKEETP